MEKTWAGERELVSWEIVFKFFVHFTSLIIHLVWFSCLNILKWEFSCFGQCLAFGWWTLNILIINRPQLTTKLHTLIDKGNMSTYICYHIYSASIHINYKLKHLALSFWLNENIIFSFFPFVALSNFNLNVICCCH